MLKSIRSIIIIFCLSSIRSFAAESTLENPCVVCDDNESDRIFLPCRHICICQDCEVYAEKKPRCIICLKDIDKIIGIPQQKVSDANKKENLIPFFDVQHTVRIDLPLGAIQSRVEKMLAYSYNIYKFEILHSNDSNFLETFFITFQEESDARNLSSTGFPWVSLTYPAILCTLYCKEDIYTELVTDTPLAYLNMLRVALAFYLDINVKDFVLEDNQVTIKVVEKSRDKNSVPQIEGIIADGFSCMNNGVIYRFSRK